MSCKSNKNFAFGRPNCQELVLLLAAVTGFTAAAFAPPAWGGSLGDHIQFLSANGSRTTGYPGAVRAAEYLENQLAAAGIVDVRRRSFVVPVPMDHGAYLELVSPSDKHDSTADRQRSANRIQLHHVWPNLARTSTLPPAGIQAPLLYGGNARQGELDGLALGDAILVLEYNCGSDWISAFDLGARAVIFLEPSRTHRKEGALKFLTTPADLPRFYARGREAIRLRDLAKQGAARVRLKGKMTWQEAPATTVVALIPGTDPQLRREAVMVGCYYDAISPIPAISPGAEQASGVAAWLEIARVLQGERLPRTVILAATPGHFQSLAGMRDLIGAVRREGLSSLGDGFDDLELAYYVGIDLSSHGSRIGLIQAGSPYRVRKIRPPIYDAIERFADRYEREQRQGRLILGGELKPYRERGLLGAVPEQIPVEGAVANLAGYLGLTFVTAGDMRNAFDSPLDLPHLVDLEQLKEQTDFLGSLLIQLLGDPTAGTQIDPRKDSFGTVQGRALTWGAEAYGPNLPIEGALVRVRTRHHVIMGVRMDPLALSDGEGRFSFAGVEARTLYLKPIQLEMFRTDDRTGELNFALDHGPFGVQQYPNEIRMDQLEKELSLVGFWCQPITLFDTFDPLSMKTLEHLEILDANSDARPVNFGFSTTATPDEIETRGYFNSAGSGVEQVAVAFLPPGVAAKFTMTGGRFRIGRALLLLNGSWKQPTGSGFAAARYPRLHRTGLQIATDTYELNAARLGNLRRHGINSPLLERAHTATESLLTRARGALTARRYDRYSDLTNKARTHASRTYNGVQGLTMDVVHGVLFFLFLLLPVAYFGERLLLEGAQLRQQVLGALGIFLIAFFLLRYLHPAFQLSIFPLVILLGFLILALSLVVAVMGISRLNAQLRSSVARRAAHRDDTDRTGLLFRALLMGIGQLRRRPLRTALTSLTLVLLTFSMLSFTSIREAVRYNETPIGPAEHGDALLVRNPGWEALEHRVLEILRSRFGRASTAARAWYVAPATAEYGARWARVNGTLGLMPNEPLITAVDKTLVAGRWFSEDEEDVCLVSTRMADKLGLTTRTVGKESIRFLGTEFRVIGFFDPRSLDQLRDVSGGPLTPLDQETHQPAERTIGRGSSEIQSAFAHLESARVLILPFEVVRRWGEKSRMTSVAVSTRNGNRAAHDLAQEISLNLFAVKGGARYLINTAGVQAFTGRPGIWVPILVAALIVFNTMLGSVHERIGDIGTLNAIGLAPMHVGGLFLAEAVVYAVISSALGYLLGQSVAKLGLLFGMFPGLTVNYSSLSAVATTAAVAVVVLLSTLYPAREAARICVPGIERSWRLPPADGDTLSVPMPFALSRNEAAGLVVFISEFLEGHTDQSIGALFYAEETELESSDVAPNRTAAAPPSHPVPILRARLWLAPFDQGLSQEFELHPVAEVGARFFAIEAVMVRRSGDRSAWLRSNKLLLNQLRKQFLVWRSLTPATRSPYLQMGRLA